MRVSCPQCSKITSWPKEENIFCGDHPDQPWGHDGCGAAGELCPCIDDGSHGMFAKYADADEPPAPGEVEAMRRLQ